MRPTRQFLCVVFLAWTALISAASLRAQELVREALSSFPHDTIRLEYSHPTALRSLPNYSSLRQRYEGPRLREVEGSLSRLGIQESDIDELVLGWRLAENQWALYGLTSGRFNPKGIADRATAQGLATVAIEGVPAYCLSSEARDNCVIVLENSLGAFGPLDSLRAILEVRGGMATRLESDNTFAKLVSGAGTKAPIWGVAVGPAVADWFKGWMPNQGDLKLDWTQTFKSVEALTYSVEPGNTVRLNVRMDCATIEDATRLRQVFEGLKLFQQLAWQNQNPGRPNPYQDLEVEASDRRVVLKLNTPYSALETGGASGGG